MLRKPTNRRRGKSEQIELNLVPILDTMVTIIAFLLFTMSFLVLAHIESPFPVASMEDLKEQVKKKPLQLTLSLHDKDAQIWSPFDLIPKQVIPNQADGVPDLRAIRTALIGIKSKFITENKIVLVPTPQVNYENLILIMDAVRLLEKTDPPLFTKNPTTGQDEVVKFLFPEVVFGNLLGDMN